MFEGLIKIALKSALELPEVKEKIMNSKIKKQKNKNNKIINLDKNSYMVLKNDY